MKSTETNSVPGFFQRIYSVWYRYARVYVNNIYSNAFPPFFEPLIFLAGIGLGLGTYITQMDGMPYIKFLASGLLITTAMFTAAFECTYGTFLRLEYDKVYDGILAAPISVRNLIFGEILWASTKGFFFSAAVMLIITVFGIIRTPYSLLVPIVGFVTGFMVASMALIVTSFVKTINHFTFFFTGVITPMFFFSGVVFPTNRLPAIVRPIVELLPVTHAVRLTRALCTEGWNIMLLWDIAYCIFFSLITSLIAIHLLRKRLVG